MIRRKKLFNSAIISSMTIERHERTHLFARPDVTVMQPDESEVITDYGLLERRVLIVESPDAVIVESYQGFSKRKPMELKSTQRLERDEINTFKGGMATAHDKASFKDVLKGRTISYHWKPDNS